MLPLRLSILFSRLLPKSDDDIDLLATLRREREPPTPCHNNPSDFGLTQEDADFFRLRYLSSLRNEYKEQATLFHQYAVSTRTSKDQMWFVMWQCNHFTRLHDEVVKKIAFLKSRKTRPKDPKSFNLEEIKAIPIENFVDVHPNTGSFRIREERTPSCHLYRAQNRWHDFGTGEGGSVIDLIMIIRDCSFVEACKYLSNSDG
jgi:hypothetical protein